MNSIEILIPPAIPGDDRSVMHQAVASLPVWALEWQTPDLQGGSRTTIDLGRIERFPGPGNSSVVVGHDVYNHLVDENLLIHCLNLQRGTAIACSAHCHSVFKGDRVYLWQSVVEDITPRHNLLVPFIQNIRGQMPIIYWWSLDYQINLEHALGLLY